MDRITHSEMQCYKTCPKKAYLNYQLRIRPDKDSPPLRIGSAVHLGLDVYKRNLIDGKNNDPLKAIAESPLDEFEREVVARLLVGYFKHWQNYPIRYIQSEYTFDIPLTDKYNTAGQMDAIADVGETVLMEHKTTSDDISPASDYWQRLLIDSQISLYYSAANILGHNVTSVLYDVVRKPSIKPGKVAVLDDDGLKQVVNINTGERIYNKNGKPKLSVNDSTEQILLTRPETAEEYGDRITADIAERPDYYYARRIIPRTRKDMDQFREELFQVVEMIEHSKQNNAWPRNTGACVGFYRCQYFDICTTGAELDPIPSGFRKESLKHRELQL